MAIVYKILFVLIETILFYYLKVTNFFIIFIQNLKRIDQKF